MFQQSVKMVVKTEVIVCRPTYVLAHQDLQENNVKRVSIIYCP